MSRLGFEPRFPSWKKRRCVILLQPSVYFFYFLQPMDLTGKGPLPDVPHSLSFWGKEVVQR